MKRVAVLVTVAASFVASAAQAQLASGYSGFSGAPRDGTLDEFYWTLAEMGRCFAQSRKAEALSLTASSRGSKAEMAAVGAMFGRPSMCVRGASKIGVPTYMIRGAIAEALYEKSGRPVPAALTAVTPVTLNKADRATTRMDGVLDAFAGCLAMARPADVHDLLAKTKLGSKAEDAYVTRMSAAFNQCLSTDGTVRFRASELRLGLAEAIYRRTSPGAAVANKVN